MNTSESSRFVRLQVEMVLEITDPAALSGTALESIAAEFGEPGGEAAEERMLAEAAVREDGAEALASLIDPFDLVSEVPGVELTHASWSSESVDYDPADPDAWDLDEEDETDDEADEEGAAYEDHEAGAADGIPHNGVDDGEHSGVSGGAERRV
ncbi:MULTISPECIES: hypothetical protein [unclassified Streptomyces]|uniref:hypothetical protein n=1 Tax=unclassified Streptomyces TaxID=2593676 RepID=UPI00224FAD1C|nr:MULTISPECIES: hypothetical protein [unclassified Streptomyces]MCX4788920.1 hypothetical protein [Streptomyces sp. NBC_01221]WSJ36638.1 hypothetical protein OG772_11720 [Streptomyces sp. NBC_01321]WSP63056.1 hypothetical protein OG466_15020 [Streptomyces sp. NBC_01240]WSU22165.1 hypothetical protein OG508_15105 [Streptomyces sp. NBC_01108]